MRHPTQIYESLFHITAAVLAVYAIKARYQSGNLMPLYILGYAAFRFLTEFIRPEPATYGVLTFYQLSAIAIATAMLLILICRYFRQPPDPVLSATQRQP